LPRKRTNCNPIRKEVKISRHLQNIIDRILASGDFTSESDVIRTAIYCLGKEYETGNPTKRSKIEERMERMENLLKELSNTVEALREEIGESDEEEEEDDEEECEVKKSETKKIILRSGQE